MSQKSKFLAKYVQIILACLTEDQLVLSQKALQNFPPIPLFVTFSSYAPRQEQKLSPTTVEY